MEVLTIKELLDQLVDEVSRRMEPPRAREYYRLKDLVDAYSDVFTAVQPKSMCFDLPADDQPQYLWVMTSDALLSFCVESLQNEEDSWTLEVCKYPLSRLLLVRSRISFYSSMRYRGWELLFEGQTPFSIIPNYRMNSVDSITQLGWVTWCSAERIG